MSKPTILCVDDEMVILKSLRTQLKAAFGDKYSYEIAEDPEEALEVIDELTDEGSNVIIIVSDWLMPKMKGDDFLIQVHQRFPGVIKLMLTGQADERAIERAKSEANLYSCISKPWSEGELIETIKSALGKL
ncbi:MAG: response regulator [Microcoleaceae cyanobacterium]